ncbi:Glutathione transferase [Mycena indigotica]|uniref:Glutathione transferase n=1 Tax=Mycena indigotica TaxID=2126181 RepID=A0A8H6SNE5_9AGAR|nr:Glutathione transferase [Mycena indigotica]KAF7302002.1 Glutathione transferase [Mycena indigotica]
MSIQKSYHRICTGVALETVQNHSAAQDITLFSSCFSPSAQRVWTAMEYLGIPYQYCRNEVDMRKRDDLLEISPKGLVPALKLHNRTPTRGLHESTVILDYLEELAAQSTNLSLLPKDPYARALVRLQCDHVNRAIVPYYYRFLQAQGDCAQMEAENDFRQALGSLVALLERAEDEVVGCGAELNLDQQKARVAGLGLWNDGGSMNLTDVMVAPFVFRASNVLKYYRGFELPNEPKFRAWTTRLFEHPAFKATCSTEELYIDSSEGYAQNRPNISKIANAINSGRPLP